MKRSDTNVRNPTYTLPTQTLPHNLKPFPLSLCRRRHRRPPPPTYPLFSLPPPPPPTATTADLSSLLSAATTTADRHHSDLSSLLFATTATTDTYICDFSLPGAALRAIGLNRIGNLLVHDDNYCKFEDWIIPIFDQMLEEQSTKVF